jgi:ribosome-binding protein aMBF1 (putative translation factor)
MLEQMKCPKCGGTNVKVHVNHRGAKVGKCHGCSFWGNLGKADPEEAKKAKQNHNRKKKGSAEVKAAPASNRRVTGKPAGDGKPVGRRKRDAGPIEYEPPTQRRWYDDFFDFLS